MSDTFFTRSGSSPGDADSTRPSLYRPPQKKPIKRAFTGMAGSLLARIEEPITAPAEPPTIDMTPAPVPTPKAYAARKRRAAATDAREAAKAKVRERAQVPPPQRKIEDQKEKWREKVVAEAVEREEKEIAKQAKRQNDGSVMNDAPRGQGRLATGGYSPTKIADVVAAHDRDEYGRRVKGVGASVQRDEKDTNDNCSGKIIGTKKGAKYVETAVPRFYVKLCGDYEDRGPLASMIGSLDNGKLDSYVIEIVPDTDVFRCAACGFETDWWSKIVRHFEDEVREEAGRFEASMKIASAAAEALEEMVLLAPADTPPMTILRPVMGTHARWFKGFKKALWKAARKRKATGQHTKRKGDTEK